MSAPNPAKDKYKNVCWIKNPEKLFGNTNTKESSSFRNGDDSDKDQNHSKSNTKSTTKEKNEEKEKTELEKTIETVLMQPKKETIEEIDSNFELKCLDIMEQIIRKYKSKNYEFINQLDGVCSIFNCNDTKLGKEKIQMIRTLLLNLSEASLEEMGELKKVYKTVFLPDHLKKFVVKNEDIICHAMENVFCETSIGTLHKNKKYEVVFIKLTSSQFTESLLNEALMMSTLNHPNILRLLAINRDITKIVFEAEDDATNLYNLCSPGMSLFYQEKKIKPKDLFNILIKVAQGMEYIHRQKIIHRDLKCSNVLIWDSNVKICNFNFAAKVDESIEEYIDTKELNGYNICPESLKTKKFTTKSDVWAMGVLCIESFILISQRSVPMPFALFESMVMSIIMDKFRNGVGGFKRPEKCSRPFFSYIINTLLHKDPKKRPNFEQIVTTMQKLRSSF